MKNANHTKHRPTKEIFYPSTYAAGGQGMGAIGGFSGPIIDADDEYGYVNCYMPKDYDMGEEIVLVFISRATATPMYMRIVTDYGKNGEAYFEHNELVQLGINTVLNRIQELNLYDAVDTVRLEAGDYLGIQVRRVAGQNTNLMLLGVRVKYRYK